MESRQQKKNPSEPAISGLKQKKAKEKYNSFTSKSPSKVEFYLQQEQVRTLNLDSA